MVGALLAAEGYEVREAPDGASGVARATENEPDAVLLDLMMPGELDGIAVLGKLREQLPDVPIVMMSGRAGLSDAVKATKLGAFTVASAGNGSDKPFVTGSPAAAVTALSVAQTAVLEAPRQLHSHLRGALHAGATFGQIEGTLSVVNPLLSFDQWKKIKELWRTVREGWSPGD